MTTRDSFDQASLSICRSVSIEYSSVTVFVERTSASSRGHVGVLDRFLEVQDHLVSELANAIDRAGLRFLVEPLADALIEIFAPCVVVRRFDVTIGRY